MSSDALELPRSLSRDETGTLLGRTMGLVALTTGSFAIGAYLGRDISYSYGWLFFIASFACLIAISVAAQRSEWASVGLLFAFGVLIGLAVSPVLSYYSSTDPQVLWLSGGATALFIAGFGAAGYATRRDLAPVARGLFWALIGLILFGIVTIFTQIPHGQLIYAILGLAIFAGLTAFDFQRLKRSTDVRTAPLLAASIFLDVLNVFLLFLSLAGGRDRK
jgi:modulator of FtsH protease